MVPVVVVGEGREVGGRRIYDMSKRRGVCLGVCVCVCL